MSIQTRKPNHNHTGNWETSLVFLVPPVVMNTALLATFASVSIPISYSQAKKRWLLAACNERRTWCIEYQS